MPRRITTIALIVCVVLILTGCQNPVRMFLHWLNGNGEHASEELGKESESREDVEEDEEGDAGIRDTVLYYRDGDGYLVPVSTDIKWEDGIARAAIMKLVSAVKGSELTQRTGLYSALPADTEVLGLTIRDGLAKVDLSAEALGCKSAEEEELMLKSLVYTLTEFNTVDRVQFMFEGDRVEALKFGTDVAGPMERKGINAVNGNSSSTLTVFFSKTNETGYQYFVPVTYGIGTVDADMGMAIECLLEGPPENSGLQSFIPADVKMNGMGTKNGIAYLNFEKGIFNYEGNDSIAENIVKSITLTLKEYPVVKGIVFLVDGQPAVLPTGIILESVIDVPVFANEYN